MRKNKIGLLTICGVLLVVLVALSLFPVLSISRYDRMSADDYDFSIWTNDALRRGGSFGDTLSAAVGTVLNIYDTWQGTYSAVFLFSLQPGIWGHTWYPLTPVILITTLMAGLGYFLFVVCKRLLGGSKSMWLISWMIAVMLCVQFPRDASEAFFWYNGSMYYTFFFSILLFWCGLALDTTLNKHLGAGNLVVRAFFLVFLAAFIAGGNYPSALLLGMILAGWLGWSVWKRHARLPLIIATSVVFAVGFIINMSAPGNAIRQANLDSLSPAMAVFTALIGTPKRIIGQLFRFPSIVAIILLIWVPFCVRALRDSKAKFRLPLLLPLASYFMLAAMFTPSYYAMGYSGPYRLWNIVMYAFYLLLLANLYYFIGWWKRRLPAQYTKSLGWLLRVKRIAPVYVVIVMAAAILLSGTGPSIGLEREGATSVRAFKALRNGTTCAYAFAFDAQAAAIIAAQHEPVEVSSIIAPESLFHNGDLSKYLLISNEPSKWYGKDLVVDENNP